MSYYALYLPHGDWKRCGALEEAEQYIASRRCESCVKELEAYGDEALLACDAEWDILDEAEALEIGLPPLDEIKESTDAK